MKGDYKMQPKVSVIIPVYNVEAYLSECLESVLCQSLESIEIICVNDGSTDNSLSILQEYSLKDDRIRIINKDNAGYGAAMNDGIKAASGEYVAFLESDDAIAPNAYERLSMLADANNVDIIKANYYEMIGAVADANLKEIVLTEQKDRYGKVFRPLMEKWSFYIPMINCSGLFNRKFLMRNAILHNETPGAAHQDMGFWFQTFCCANTALLVNEPFYMYRQDNENSSMKNDTTAFSTLGEYDSMLKFLRERPVLMKEALSVYSHRKYTSCMFAYSTSELSLKLPFLRALSDSYRKELKEGVLDFSRFSKKDKLNLHSIIDDPDAYYLSSLNEECVVSKNALKQMKQEISRLNTMIDNYKINSEKNQEDQKATNVQNWKELKNNPVISVVIPVYNTEKYLKECLDSILSQSLKDIEVICVNDGSDDSSGEILSEYSDQDSRVIVLNQQNSGQASARNLGMRHAKGRFIQFVDSDDEIAPDSLKVLSTRMISDDLDILFFDGKTIYEDINNFNNYKQLSSTYVRTRSYGDVLSGSNMLIRMKKDKAYRVSPCMAMFSRRFLSENKIEFPQFIIYEDNVFMAESIVLASRVGHLNEQYYYRRVREESTTTSEITAFHVQSYFYVYLRLMELSEKYSISYDLSEALSDEMNIVLRTIKKYYAKLSPLQKELVFSMPPTKRELFHALIAEEIKPCQSNKNDIERIYSSNSWKIGRAVTFGPRMIKRSVRKLKKRSR